MRLRLILIGVTILGLHAPIRVQAQEQGQHTGVMSTAIPGSAEEIRPLLVGTKIPKTILTTADGLPYDLNAAVSKQPTVLIFYRGGWCPYCNLQFGQLQSAEAELVKLGYQILAVSADRPAKLRESIEKKQLNYTLLSDSSTMCAQAFGIAFRMTQNVVEKYKTYNIDLENASGAKHHMLPVPAAFILGTDGLIKFAYVNPNYKIRIDPEVLLAAAKSALK